MLLPLPFTHKMYTVFTDIRLGRVTCVHAPGSLTCDDQIGRSDSVEQAHCTLGAVKRCRALSEGGGLPNFWFILHEIT